MDKKRAKTDLNQDEHLMGSRDIRTISKARLVALLNLMIDKHEDGPESPDPPTESEGDSHSTV